MIDDFLKNFDQSKIKVIAGDLPYGTWEIDGTSLRQTAIHSDETIDLANSVSNIKLKNEVAKNQFEPLVGAGVGALVGGRMFGIIGLVAGAAVGGVLMSGRAEVSVNCELKDGRTFIAVMSPEMLEKLKAVSHQ